MFYLTSTSTFEFPSWTSAVLDAYVPSGYPVYTCADTGFQLLPIVLAPLSNILKGSPPCLYLSPCFVLKGCHTAAPYVVDLRLGFSFCISKATFPPMLCPTRCFTLSPCFSCSSFACSYLCIFYCLLSLSPCAL